MWKNVKFCLKTETNSYSLFSSTFSFCLVFSLSLQQNQNTNAYRAREREMGVVVGVILDESVVLASDSPQHENPSLLPLADSLLRKLRHSKIPTVFFSLSSSTSLFFAQYIITTVLGFLWFEVYKLFFMVNYSIFMYL